MRPSPNILTVDVECWEAIFHRRLTGQSFGECPGCVQSVERLLKIMYAKGVKATFFVVGEFAERHPDLIRAIDAAGHEIAGHGYVHTPMSTLTDAEFEVDTAKCVAVLSSIIGKSIRGYRAPVFSLSLDRVQTLAKLGFRYDSSFFPFRSNDPGAAAFPRGPVKMSWNEESIFEVPVSTLELGPYSAPVAGGGYMRLLPAPALFKAVALVNKRGDPFVTYCHPYEFSKTDMDFRPFTPWLGKVRTALTSVRFNLFREGMRSKLEALLDRFVFTSMREALTHEHSRD